MSLKEKQSWTLQQKVAHALALIDEFYHFYKGECYISFSGGKDSSLLWWLCNKFTDACGYPRMKVVFNNTTNEHRQILAFVKSYGDEIIWLQPRMTFVESVKNNGYPLISKEQSQYIREAKTTKSEKLRNIRLYGKKKTAKSGRKYLQGKIANKWLHLVDHPIQITNKCCDILKKDPARKFERDTGLKPILGVTADEGGMRKQMAFMRNYCNTYGNRPVARPLNIFLESDVWDVILSNKIPYCDIYDDQVIDGVLVKGEQRTGCAYCAFGEHLQPPDNNKFTRLYYREPKRYKTMMDKIGYRDALHLVGIKLPDDPNTQTKLF